MLSSSEDKLLSHTKNGRMKQEKMDLLLAKDNWVLWGRGLRLSGE